MIKDAVPHVGPAKARTRKRISCEPLEYFDSREENKFAKSNLKLDLTMQARDCVKDIADQTETKMPRGMMNVKANDEDCLRSTNEIEILLTLSLSDEHLRQENSVGPFSHETQPSDLKSVCDSHVEPNAEESQKIESPLEEESVVDIAKHVSATGVDQVENWSKVSHLSLERVPVAFPRRKLLILDVNGLLADVVFPSPKECKGDTTILRRAIFKRPFYYEFLAFCFERFDVGIWSSRSRKIIDRVVDYLLGDMKHKLLFCWDISQCTETGYNTLENKHKPLVCKELRKIWEKYGTDLPWEKGDYDESNTLLLDDSPYKALFNPIHTAVFPHSFTYKDTNDTSLGPGGDIRVYVENLARVENMKKYVEQHPFGQSGIDETSSVWDFYSKVLCTWSTVPTPS